jgi:type IV secretory pathway VirJ component
VKKERTPHDAAKDVAYQISLIRMRWEAYKAIQAGGTYSVGNKKIYDSLRKRLARMFQGNEEKLSRFKLLE